MGQALRAKEILIRLFKRYEKIIIIILKFIIGLFIFSLISGINKVLPEVGEILSPEKSSMLIPLMSLLFAVVPMTLGYVLMIIYLGIQISAALEIAIVVVLFLVLLIIFYSRLAPKENVLVLGMIIAYYLKLPYLIPILAGMYFSVTSIIPITIGVFIWQFIPVVKNLMNTITSAGSEIANMPDSYKALYEQLIKSVEANTDWIVISFIFSVITLVVFAISKLFINYSKEMAIVAGAILNIVCFFTATLIGSLNINILGVFISTICSLLIMGLIRFFDPILDYNRAERIDFQDEDNVYYVKVIPKINLSKPKRTIKRIRPENEE